MATAEVTEEHFFVSLHVPLQLEKVWIFVAAVFTENVFFHVSFRVVGPT